MKVINITIACFFFSACAGIPALPSKVSGVGMITMGLTKEQLLMRYNKWTQVFHSERSPQEVFSLLQSQGQECWQTNANSLPKLMALKIAVRSNRSDDNIGGEINVLIPDEPISYVAHILVSAGRSEKTDVQITESIGPDHPGSFGQDIDRWLEGDLMCKWE